MNTDIDPGDDPFVCNGCLCDLYDIRYKCLTCPDFDLCENCQQLDRKIGDHDPTQHFALKLNTKSEKASNGYQSNEEGSIEDLKETLAVLDGFQCFHFDVQAMASNLHMPVASIRQTMDRMIDREIEFSKLEKSRDDTADSSDSYGLPFLEICNIDDTTTGTKFMRDDDVDCSVYLESIWTSISRIGDQSHKTDLEAAKEILILEDAFRFTSLNANHAICALKRCNDIASRPAISRRWELRKKFASVSLSAIQRTGKKNFQARRRLHDAIKNKTPGIAKAMEEVLKNSQLGWPLKRPEKKQSTPSIDLYSHGLNRVTPDVSERQQVHSESTNATSSPISLEIWTDDTLIPDGAHTLYHLFNSVPQQRISYQFFEPKAFDSSRPIHPRVSIDPTMQKTKSKKSSRKVSLPTQSNIDTIEILGSEHLCELIPRINNSNDAIVTVPVVSNCDQSTPSLQAIFPMKKLAGILCEAAPGKFYSRPENRISFKFQHVKSANPLNSTGTASEAPSFHMGSAEVINVNFTRSCASLGDSMDTNMLNDDRRISSLPQYISMWAGLRYTEESSFFVLDNSAVEEVEANQHCDLTDLICVREDDQSTQKLSLCDITKINLDQSGRDTLKRPLNGSIGISVDPTQGSLDYGSAEGYPDQRVQDTQEPLNLKADTQEPVIYGTAAICSENTQELPVNSNISNVLTYQQIQNDHEPTDIATAVVQIDDKVLASSADFTHRWTIHAANIDADYAESISLNSKNQKYLESNNIMRDVKRNRSECDIEMVIPTSSSSFGVETSSLLTIWPTFLESYDLSLEPKLSVPNPIITMRPTISGTNHCELLLNDTGGVKDISATSSSANGGSTIEVAPIEASLEPKLSVPNPIITMRPTISGTNHCELLLNDTGGVKDISATSSSANGGSTIEVAPIEASLEPKLSVPNPIITMRPTISGTNHCELLLNDTGGVKDISATSSSANGGSTIEVAPIEASLEPKLSVPNPIITMRPTISGTNHCELLLNDTGGVKDISATSSSANGGSTIEVAPIEASLEPKLSVPNPIITMRPTISGTNHCELLLNDTGGVKDISATSSSANGGSTIEVAPIEVFCPATSPITPHSSTRKSPGTPVNYAINSVQSGIDYFASVKSNKITSCAHPLESGVLTKSSPSWSSFFVAPDFNEIQPELSIRNVRRRRFASENSRLTECNVERIQGIVKAKISSQGWDLALNPIDAIPKIYQSESHQSFDESLLGLRSGETTLTPLHQQTNSMSWFTDREGSAKNGSTSAMRSCVKLEKGASWFDDESKDIISPDRFGYYPQDGGSLRETEIMSEQEYVSSASKECSTRVEKAPCDQYFFPGELLSDSPVMLVQSPPSMKKIITIINADIKLPLHSQLSITVKGNEPQQIPIRSILKKSSGVIGLSTKEISDVDDKLIMQDNGLCPLLNTVDQVEMPNIRKIVFACDTKLDPSDPNYPTCQRSNHQKYRRPVLKTGPTSESIQSIASISDVSSYGKRTYSEMVIEARDTVTNSPPLPLLRNLGNVADGQYLEAAINAKVLIDENNKEFMSIVIDCEIPESSKDNGEGSGGSVSGDLDNLVVQRIKEAEQTKEDRPVDMLFGNIYEPYYLIESLSQKLQQQQISDDYRASILIRNRSTSNLLSEKDGDTCNSSQLSTSQLNTFTKTTSSSSTDQALMVSNVIVPVKTIPVTVESNCTRSADESSNEVYTSTLSDQYTSNNCPGSIDAINLSVDPLSDRTSCSNIIIVSTKEMISNSSNNYDRIEPTHLTNETAPNLMFETVEGVEKLYYKKTRKVTWFDDSMTDGSKENEGKEVSRGANDDTKTCTVGVQASRTDGGDEESQIANEGSKWNEQIRPAVKNRICSPTDRDLEGGKEIEESFLTRLKIAETIRNEKEDVGGEIEELKIEYKKEHEIMNRVKLARDEILRFEQLSIGLMQHEKQVPLIQTSGAESSGMSLQKRGEVDERELLGKGWARARSRQEKTQEHGKGRRDEEKGQREEDTEDLGWSSNLIWDLLSEDEDKDSAKEDRVEEKDVRREEEDEDDSLFTDSPSDFYYRGSSSKLGYNSSTSLVHTSSTSTGTGTVYPVKALLNHSSRGSHNSHSSNNRANQLGKVSSTQSYRNVQGESARSAGHGNATSSSLLPSSPQAPSLVATPAVEREGISPSTLAPALGPLNPYSVSVEMKEGEDGLFDIFETPEKVLRHPSFLRK